MPSESFGTIVVDGLAALPPETSVPARSAAA
jgi:hypothetical protein